MFLVSSCSCFVQSIEAKNQVENEDVVGAGQVIDASTTTELIAILWPTKMRISLEVWQ